MKASLNMDKIARGLGGERGGKVQATAGYFGATSLASEIVDRFRVPATGGRSTDPSWTERRQVPLRPQTLARLERLAAAIQAKNGREVHPMQLAALLLEKVAEESSVEEVSGIVVAARR